MGFFANKCPRCQKGKIYGTFFSMNTACPECGYVYEREEGYFTGAMFLDTMILPLSAVPTVLFFALKGAILMGGIAAVLQIVVLSPFVFRYSRIIWIHLGYTLDSGK